MSDTESPQVRWAKARLHRHLECMVACATFKRKGRKTPRGVPCKGCLVALPKLEADVKSAKRN